MNFLFLFLLIFPSEIPQQYKAFFSSSFELLQAPGLEFITPQIIFHGSRKAKKIALTFDACATGRKSKYDSAIVETLIREKITATFFISGLWAVMHRQETKYIALQSQFEIGNHSFSHPHFKKLKPNEMEEELRITQNVLFTITGKQPKYFRHPYGEYDSSTIAAAAKVGFVSIQYDLPSGDPDTNATAKKLVSYVSSKAQNGSIIVMHVNKRGWHTAEALPEIISRLRKRGFEFVTVSELLKEN